MTLRGLSGLVIRYYVTLRGLAEGHEDESQSVDTHHGRLTGRLTGEG